MIGTVDMKREYHPYGIMLTKTEDELDYQYLCQRLKALAALVEVNFNPTVLLADAAGAITNGCKSVFNLGKKKIFFFFHTSFLVVTFY